MQAQTLRFATLNTELARDGPGLLFRDIVSEDAPDILAVQDLVLTARPDVIVLTNFDFDLSGAAIRAFSRQLAKAGHDLPHHFAVRPNTGMATGLDLDGNGRLGGPRDAQGFGRFAGQGGMAILSRFPADARRARDFSGVLWKDVPGSLMVARDRGYDVQRLSSVGHWDVVLKLPDGTEISVFAFHATPPVFDGPEDRNGRRNHDEAAFWLAYLDGQLDHKPYPHPFVLMGDANMDVSDPSGLSAAMARLLRDPRLQDPLPAADRGRDFARSERGINLEHKGDPARDTANWPDGADGPGNLRVDYVLPSAEWTVLDAGIDWADAGSYGGEGSGPRHGIVWVDVILDR